MESAALPCSRPARLALGCVLGVLGDQIQANSQILPAKILLLMLKSPAKIA